MRLPQRAGLTLLTAATFAVTSASPPRGDPQPQDANRAILAAFDTFPIVAIGDYPESQDLQAFALSLIRSPALAGVVNDIIVEGTNGNLQPLLDRYIEGEDIPLVEARRLWRDGMNPVALDAFQAELFPLIRRLNQERPPGSRLRVVAGEAGIDWATATPAISGQYVGHRDEHIASVLEAEAVANHRKILMLYGGGHLWHGFRGDAGAGYENAIGIFESKHPGLAFVIEPYVGGVRRSQCGLPVSVDNIDVAAKMRLWFAPSLARTKGTWLETVAAAERWTADQNAFAAQLGKRLIDSTAVPYDAYLYLGRPELLLATQPSLYGFADKEYVAELRRRQMASGGTGNDPRTDPDVARAREGSVFLCTGQRTR